MKISGMRRIDDAFEALQPVASLQGAERLTVGFRPDEELEVGNHRRFALAHIGPYRAAFFLHRIGLHRHGIAELALLGRLVDALAVHVEQPAVIEAANAAVLDSAIAEIGAAMRAVALDQAKTILVVAEQDQVFAHDADRQGIAARRDFFRRRDGLPIAPQELAARRAGAGARQQIVLCLSQHDVSLSLYSPARCRRIPRYCAGINSGARVSFDDLVR